MNRVKLHVRKGDQVEVISGNFKGSSGKVLEVIRGRAGSAGVTLDWKPGE